MKHISPSSISSLTKAEEFTVANRLDGKVVAITDKAIVVADTANPAGGFTDAEYRSIGVTFDTLVDPVDRVEHHRAVFERSANRAHAVARP